MILEHYLFKMIKSEKFTSLTIAYDYKKKSLELKLAKEWNQKVNWNGAKTTGLLKRVKKLNTDEVQDIIERYQLDNYFDDIAYFIREGCHKLLELVYDPISEACCVVAIHNDNKEYTVGGIRRTVINKPEKEVLTEALNLSRAMSFRCAAAQIPCSGACLIFYAPRPTNDNIEKLLSFLGYISCRYEVKWGTESGFSGEEMKKINDYTQNLVTQNSAQAIASCAAYSIYIAVKETLRHRYEAGEIKNKLIGIEGVGKLGSKIAEMLLKDGAEIIVSDRNAKQIENFMKQYKSKYKDYISSVPVGGARMQMGHVFIPCAYSGALSHDSIQEIKYHIIVGGANHLLAANVKREEIKIAKLLMKTGIIYIPDWIANIGAVKYATELILTNNLPDVEKVYQKLDEICVDLINDIVAKSKEKNISPLEEAYARFIPVVYE